jgi:hypothetical protein
MIDSVDKLSTATGLSRAAMLEIMDEVKSNHATLAVCGGHNFESEDPRRLDARWVCTACGGRASYNQVHWYNLGRSHG